MSVASNSLKFKQYDQFPHNKNTNFKTARNIKMAQKMENNKKLKRVWEERLELQEQHGKIKQKYQENNEAMRKLIDGKEQEINQLRKQNEQMRKTIQDLETNTKACQKKIRMLVKNNAKKRKLLSTPAIVNGWNEWSLEEPEDEEEQEAWEELETCWKSSDESADEAD